MNIFLLPPLSIAATENFLSQRGAYKYSDKTLLFFADKMRDSITILNVMNVMLREQSGTHVGVMSVRDAFLWNLQKSGGIEQIRKKAVEAEVLVEIVQSKIYELFIKYHIYENAILDERIRRTEEEITVLKDKLFEKYSLADEKSKQQPDGTEEKPNGESKQ